MLGRAGEPGIMALTLNDLFTAMEQNKDKNLYHVTMAYLEVRERGREVVSCIPFHQCPFRSIMRQFVTYLGRHRVASWTSGKMLTELLLCLD